MSIGFHVSKDGRKLPVAIKEDLEYMRSSGVKSPCVQIFVSGPKNYKETLTDDDKARVRNILISEKIPLVIHGSYVDNPWNMNMSGIANIKLEMRVAHRIGATGVVVHLAAQANNDKNLKIVLEKLAQLEPDVKKQCIIWFEINAAKSSPNTFETPQKLGILFNHIRQITGDPAEDPTALRIGLCIDSAHLFSCGMPLDTYTTTKEWLNDTTAALPTGTPIMMHLNDSGAILGHGIDRHAALTRGNLWGGYNINTGYLKIEDSGLIAILEWAKSENIMLILERDSDGIKNDLELLNKLGF